MKRILAALIFFALPALSKAVNPTILSVSKYSTDASIHIGSTVLVHMVILDVNRQLGGVSVTASSTGSLTVSSSELASLTGTPFVYITDGTRSWRVAYAAANLVINNANLVGGNLVPANVPGGWSVADYGTLQNVTFRMYAGSSLPAASTIVSANLGSFANIDLNDLAVYPDAVASSEVWSGFYVVPDLGYTVFGSRVTGYVYAGPIGASNNGFQSPATLDLDALRPKIESFNFTVPARPNYNNVLYLSERSQGNATPDPTNSQGRFEVTTNKTNTFVDISIATTPVKNLSTIFIPSGASTPTGWRTWDGDAGNNNFVPDGIYSATMVVRDGNDVYGLTVTTQVRVTSMRFELQNIRLSPSGRQAQPTFTDGMITQIEADVVAYRDLNNSLRSSFIALNWPDTFRANFGSGAVTNNLFATNYLLGGVYSVPEISFLNQAGNLAFGVDVVANKDQFEGTDEDSASHGVNYTGDPYLGGGVCGDQDETNDWTFNGVALTHMDLITGTTANPTLLRGSYSAFVTGNSPAQGDYRLRLRARLTGLFLAATGDADPTNTTCSAQPHHFYPTIYPEGGLYSEMGQGLYAEDSTVIFRVSNVIIPTSDNTPPVYLSSNPIDNSTVAPGVYGPSAALTARFQDAESAMNPQGSVSYVKVLDPQGGLVGGFSSTDGGGPNNTLNLTFVPYASLDKGGAYKMQVSTCNNVGLCVAKDILFTVQDRTAPSIAGVELRTQTGLNSINLSINQSAAEGPYQDISEVWVTLAVPGTSSNTIDWNSSNVSLYQVLNTTTKVPVPMTRLTIGTPSDGKLKYKLNNAISTDGRFEVVTLTQSLDGSGNTYSGPPAGTINPQFITIACPTCITILYAAPGADASRPAIKANGVTTTVGAVTINAATIGVDSPGIGSLPADPGWTLLSSTLFNRSMRFFNVASLLTTPITWSFNLASPVTFYMYYNDADIPNNVAESDLQVRAFSGGAWSAVANATQNSLPITSNSFAFSPVPGQPAAVYYTISYPFIAGTTGPSGAPTPVTYKNHRSFNPNATNPLQQRARFYYSNNAPRALDVKVYDTAGRLVRSLSYGNGVGANDFSVDPVYATTSYFFEWDGKNDSNTLVRNGIYLVRWTLTKSDGSSETQTKPVALIK